MSKTPKYSRNMRVEFMDGERLHHVGFIKASHKVGLFRKEIWYDIAVLSKELPHKVLFVNEDWIFGTVEKPIKDKPLNVKEHKTYKGFDEMKELINNNE